ncbi:MAG TPA: branched-chain amino acid ABC transporter permease [Oscillospiraceae bacterium]|jgi:branched-chain amino acid transport system permease protein|nr:branched-chain amino acid ABC transporter permease [Oscillospiraceae bacterium]
MEYYLQVLTLAGINLMVVMGLGLLTGFTGLFSFGHAGFMCIGAYTSAILTVTLKVPFPIALIVAGLAAGAVSLLLGRLTLKLKGDYFLIATLGFGESVRLIFDNIEPLGGARGFSGIAKNSNFVSVWIVCIVGIFFLVRLINSRYGRNFKAIREEELASSTIGIDVFKTKLLSLFISAIYAGIGGSLYAHYMTFIKPTNFALIKSTEFTIMAIIGGLGSITGSVIGALLLTVLPELLRFVADWRMVIYGAAVVILIIVRPKGIAGGKEFKDYFFVVWIRRSFKKLFAKKDPGNGGKV